MGSPIFDSTFGTGRFKDEKFTDPPRSDASALTDEERKKLCEDLRHSWLKANPMSLDWCRKAADEIEWLAKELAKARAADRSAK